MIAGVFVELVGKTGAVAPEQIAATAAKVGVTFGVTVMLSVVIVAHCPAVGVKVYVVVAVLLIAGDQVPEIPFIELVGSGDIVAPEQNGPT